MPTISEMLELQGPSLCLDDLAAAWGNQVAKGDPGLAAAKIKGLLDELRDAIKAGELLVYSHEFKRERKYRDNGRDSLDLERNQVRVLPQSLNAWLEKLGQPTLNLPSLAQDDILKPSATKHAAASEKLKARGGWIDIVGPYIVGVWRAGRHSTVKLLHKELMQYAGTEGSPFTKAKGELFLKATGKSLALHTIENSGKRLRKEAGLS
jgi:hypothetical protein